MSEVPAQLLRGRRTPFVALALSLCVILALAPTALGQEPATDPPTSGAEQGEGESAPTEGENPAPPSTEPPPPVEGPSVEEPPPAQEPPPVEEPPVAEEPAEEEVVPPPPPPEDPPPTIVEEVIIEEVVTPVLPKPDAPRPNPDSSILLSSKRVPVAPGPGAAAPDAPPPLPVLNAPAPQRAPVPVAPLTIDAPPEAPAPAPERAIDVTLATSLATGSGFSPPPEVIRPAPGDEQTISAAPVEEIAPVPDPADFSAYGVAAGSSEGPTLLSVLAGHLIPNAGVPGSTSQLLLIGLALLLVGWALPRPAVRMSSLAERVYRPRSGFRQPQLRPG